MKLNKVLHLRKAKYIKRWRGKDGKWKYKYPREKKDRERKEDILNKKLRMVEDKIANLDYEKCYVFNEKGNIIFQKKGGETSITFSHDEMTKIQRAKVFTHNHPGLGLSFSPEDIKTAIHLHFGEVRVVSKNYIYRAIIPKDWSKDERNIFMGDVYNTWDKQGDIAAKVIKNFSMSREQVADRYTNAVWKDLDGLAGFKYIREKRK